MKNRFILSILEALERIAECRAAMGRSEVQMRLSTIDNMAWQLLDEIESDSAVQPNEQHLSPLERN